MSDRRRLWTAPHPSAKVVRRSRLEAVLEQACDRPLTSIVAAAGTGKTTLAAAWAAEQAEHGRAVLWLSQRRHGDLGPALLAARGASDPVPSDALVEELAAADHPARLVVVDDAHLLPEPESALLRHVLRECPDAVRLVLVGRRDPVLPLVEFELSDAVATVRARELRFEHDEAEQLVRAHAPGCTRQDLDLLVEQTGGWAAALVIGARSLATSGDISARLRLALTEQPVLDHLLGGYFDTMEEPVPGLLLSCCQEPDVDALSASVLSGVLDADRHLTALAEEGLLVTAEVDPQRPGGVVWRFHPLLRELLRRRTAPTGPDWRVVVDAHVRASRRYAQDGDPVLALRHAHRSGDATAVLSMLVEYGASFVTAEAFEEVAAGLLCLPEQVKTSTPHLLALDALQHRARGRIDTALSVAQEAEALFVAMEDAGGPDDQPSDGALATLAEVQLWRAALGLGDGDGDAAVAQAQRLLGCHVTDDWHVHPGSDLSLGQSASLMVELAALETWRGELASAATHLHQAEWAADSLGWPALSASALAHRCVLELAAGLYGTAADTASAALRADVAEALPADVRARAHLVRGWAATYALEPRTAQDALHEVARLAPSVDPVVRLLTRLLEVRLTSQDAQHDRALRLLASTDVEATAPLFLVRLVEVGRAEIAARSRAIPALRDAARRLQRLGLVDDAEMFDCVAPADPIAAYEVLERLLMRPRLHPATAAGAATLRMCAVLQERDLRLARALLPDLLSRVRPQRLFVFLDVVARVEPDFLHLLFHDVEDAAAHPASAEALALLRRTHRPQTNDPFDTDRGARAADAAPAEAAVDAGGAPASAAEVQLTRRQADVLAELALGGSYRDIAEHLYLTENSVKTHLGSLYRKLGAARRADALRRARELGLL